MLHNNVGVTHMGGPVDLDERTYELSMALNLGSVYRTCKAVLPHMLERRQGVIINISSLASLRWTGYPYFAYSASKAAVNQATVALAMQYARQGIRANCVVPGAIDTPLIYKQIASQYASVDEMIKARNRMVPLGRMGDPWDVAHAAVFLASDEARFITGVCLPVDGGQSCAMAHSHPLMLSIMALREMPYRSCRTGSVPASRNLSGSAIWRKPRVVTPARISAAPRPRPGRRSQCGSRPRPRAARCAWPLR